MIEPGYAQRRTDIALAYRQTLPLSGQGLGVFRADSGIDMEYSSRGDEF